MRQTAFGQRFERARELGETLGCEVDAKRLDGDETPLDRIVGAEDDTGRASTDLVKDTERAEGGRG